jgi:hypothetical protein
MARPNIILVGAIILTPAIVGAEGYAVYRKLHRRAQVAAAPAALPDPIAEEPTAAAEQPAVLPATPATAEPLPVPADQQRPPVEIDTTVVQRRLLYQRRRQMIHDADEQVFDTLSLPDAQRVAIRTIDDQYASAEAALDSGFPVAADVQAAETRRTAIAGVLGPDASRAFNVAERKAERRARHARPAAGPPP